MAVGWGTHASHQIIAQHRISSNPSPEHNTTQMSATASKKRGAAINVRRDTSSAQRNKITKRHGTDG
jgi:hypothetical protein